MTTKEGDDDDDDADYDGDDDDDDDDADDDDADDAQRLWAADRAERVAALGPSKEGHIPLGRY